MHTSQHLVLDTYTWNRCSSPARLIAEASVSTASSKVPAWLMGVCRAVCAVALCSMSKVTAITPVTCERTGLLPLTGRFNPNHKSPRSFTESFLQHQHDHRVEGGAKKKKCANSAEPLPLETKSLRLLRPPRCLPAAERSASIHPCPVTEVQKHQKHSWHIRKQLKCKDVFLLYLTLPDFIITFIIHSFFYRACLVTCVRRGRWM